MDRLTRFLNFFGRRSPAVLVACSVVLIAGIGLFDYYVGQNFSSALFFMIPIAFVTWFVGFWPGTALSVLSGTSLMLTDYAFARGSHPAVGAWNAVFPFFFFILFVLLLTRLKQALATELRLSRTDPLTGLVNRRYLSEIADAEISRSRRYGHPLSIAYMDIDSFKEINDARGHDEGDEVLSGLARIFKQNLRTSDCISRMGGDEFCLLLPEAGAEAAAAAMRNLKNKVHASQDELGWPVTLSVGVVTYNVASASLDEMLKEADGLMYSVKETSKDAIEQKVIA